MTPMRPIVLMLAIVGLASSHAAETTVPSAPASAPAELATAAPDERPIATTGEPTAKIIATSRKKQVAAKAPAQVLETFPPDGQLQQQRQPIQGTERLVYDRSPLRVALAAGRERRIYLPWEAALHLPPEAGGLQAQIVGSTIYLTGQSGQPIVRIIAEGLDGQGMIPLDVQVRDQLAGVPDEMEISVASRGNNGGNGRGKTARRNSATDDDDDDDEPVAPDLAQLTRYCSQQLYAPQRLVKTPPGVRSIELRHMPVAGLYRGGAVLTTPVGGWRSATLYVTAVRFTNRSHSPLELDMDMLRGRWVAATPQHHVLAESGSDADTTAVCLISEQSFDASRP